MSIKKILQNYHIGMAVYDRCHPPTVTSQWQAFKSEVLEFIENPSTKEAWDILHSGGKLFWKLTGIPLQLMAWPTVCKHSQRYASTRRRKLTKYYCGRMSNEIKGSFC